MYGEEGRVRGRGPLQIRIRIRICMGTSVLVLIRMTDCQYYLMALGSSIENTFCRAHILQRTHSIDYLKGAGVKYSAERAVHHRAESSFF
jgi:hypothetical protein